MFFEPQNNVTFDEGSTRRMKVFRMCFKSKHITLYSSRNFRGIGYHSAILKKENKICGFFEKHVGIVRNCVESSEHIRNDSML